MNTHHIIASILILAAGPGLIAEAADWPQWRGPDRSDVSRETGLLKSWPEGGPERAWLYENAGAGYAGISVAGGKAYTMGTRDGREILLALEAATGRELWATPMGDVLENNWGDGPRGTPTVEGGRVYALGGRGDLVCADAAEGTVQWRVTMADLGGQTPKWGYAESVLVDGDLVVCTPGGDRGTLAALDKRTGQVLWRSEGFTDNAQYTSPVVFDWNGTRPAAVLTMNTLAGVSLADGTVLWRTDWPGRTAVIPTPVYADGRVYVSSGYQVGCMLVQLGPGHTLETIYANKVMKNQHGGVLLFEGHLYGYSDGDGWVCQEVLSGEEIWRSKALGKGALTCADGMLYCVEESGGQVALAEASPEGWREAGRFTLEPQTGIRKDRGRIWTHPVVADGRLYLRDQDLIFCYGIKGTEG